MRHHTYEPKEGIYISRRVKEYLMLLMQAEYGSYRNFRENCGLSRQEVSWSVQNTSITLPFLKCLVEQGYLYRVINDCYFLRRSDITWCNSQLILKHYPTLAACLSTHGIQKTTWNNYLKKNATPPVIQKLLTRYSLDTVYKARRSLFIDQQQRTEAERALLTYYTTYQNFCRLTRFPFYHLKSFFNNMNSNYNTILLLTRTGLLRDTYTQQPPYTPIRPIDPYLHEPAFDDPDSGIYPEDPNLCYDEEEEEETPEEEEA